MAIYDLLPANLRNRSDVRQAFDSVLSWIPSNAQGQMGRMFEQMLGSVNNGAADASAYARSTETARQQQLAKARSQLGAAFDQAAPGIQAQAQQAYLDANLPGVDDAYAQAKRQQTFAAARAGAMQSSGNANAMARAFQDHQSQRAKVASGAFDAGQSALSSLDGLRQTALGTAASAVNPYAENATGLANLAAYSQPAQFSPLASMFSDLLGNAAIRQGFDQRQQAAGLYSSPTVNYRNTSGSFLSDAWKNWR